MPLRSKPPVNALLLGLLSLALVAAGYLLGRLHAAVRPTAAPLASAAAAASPSAQWVGAADRLGLEQERAAVAGELGRLQSQLARQAQDLAFYRSIATTTAPAPVTVQQLRLQAGTGRDRYALSLVLGRPLRREDPVSGTATLRVEGLRGGGQVSEKILDFSFNYRYLQQAKLEISLPPDLQPARLVLELHVLKPQSGLWQQVVPWTLEPP
jgi:hypothetical protein